MTSPADSPSPSPDQLLQYVMDHPMLKGIDPSSLEGLKDQLSWVALDNGEVLFDEGDVVDGFYFVIEGLLEACTDQEDLDGNPDNDRLVLAELGPGSTIGEMQILHGGKRSATVSAIEPSGLVRFPKTAFDRFLAADKKVVDELTKTIIPRLYRDQIIDILPKLFGEFDDEMLRDFEAKMSWRHLPRGQVLCEQGDPSDSFYIVISGRMQVMTREDSGELRYVNEIAQGETIGEMGLVTGEPRSVTVIAARDSELVEYSKEEFDEFTAKYPLLMRHLLRLLIKRFQSVLRERRTTMLSTNILLAPASDGAPLDEFAADLNRTLSSYRGANGKGELSCLLLTSKIVDELLGQHGISQSEEGEPDDLRLRSWLSHQEKKYQIILLQTDLASSAWTQRCINSADEIMYVGAANRDPGSSSIVRQVQHLDELNLTHRRRSLVLLHESSLNRPSGTMNWLRALNLVGDRAERPIDIRHFHIRRGSDDDCQRVARFLLGREVGLVLSGGGARGFAHVGCIRAMSELNIPIDMIGGVSMGSLVSAAYAFDADHFEERIQTIKSQLKGALFDLTAPVVSFARGRRFDRRLQNWFPKVKIEDLWLPYFCVSSNLTEAGLVVFESDWLWQGVRASGTLPGLTSPMIRDNCLIYDGCLLDNLPMDVMRERLGSAHVIAVDVVPPHDLTVAAPQLQSPSGWWLLWNRLNPFASKIDLPNIVSIMRRAAEVGSVYGRQRLIDQQIADLYLQPPVESIDISDFGMVEEAARIGYEGCKESLSQWWSEHQASVRP